MTKQISAKEIIDGLKLMPHPEGGFFREVHRSPMTVKHPSPPANETPTRAAMTSIYFLLEGSDFSAFHRVRSDETWHLYGGGPLELHILSQKGEYERRILGFDLGAGYTPQITIPAMSWQAACPAPNVSYALCGCTVAPGFDFVDFKMVSFRELSLSYPQHEDLIRRFTRGPR